MRNFAILTIAFLLLFFIFHGLFITFDYVYYNPDSGALHKLTEVFNETLSNTSYEALGNQSYQDICYNQSKMFRQAFNLGRFFVLGLTIVFFVLSVNEGISEHRQKKSNNDQQQYMYRR